MENIIKEKSINDVNYEILRKYFPNAISIDENGKYTIDAQKLQMSLDPSKAKIEENGYGLSWVGKKEAYFNAFSKNYKVLKPLKEISKEWDKTQNILIKGDNIDALKILRNNYFQSIKMIYIDPPYNTKNDGFVYNDNFTHNTRQTLEKLDYDEKYIDYIENIQGAKTHSGWLSFMYPRLLLAKDLLKYDGVIFISIDDNEMANLKLLCDEIFGEDNFVADFIRKTKSTTNDAKTGLNYQHEFLLCYAKNKEYLNLLGGSKNLENYKNPDNDPNGAWTSADPSAKSGTMENGYFEVKNPYTGKVDYPPQGMFWRFSKNTIQKHIDEGRICFKKKHKENERGFIYKRFLKDLKTTKKTFDSLKFTENKFMNQSATKELLSLGLAEYFSFPKGTEFIKEILIHSTDPNDIILDFFAGSGTTAHAVMDLNKEDGGKRKFILVQIDEKIDPKKSKTAYDFCLNELNSQNPSIFDITRERIKRAGEKLAQDNENLDTGFRVFEVVDDEKQEIYQKSLQEITQEELFDFTNINIQSNEEILYNLLVAENLPLSTKIKELKESSLYVAKNVVFVLNDISLDEMLELLKDEKDCEYISIYSPNIKDDKFSLDIENLSKLGFKNENIRFRG